MSRPHFFPGVGLALALNFAPLGADDRPNILWLTSEDNGPQLGCYGDDYATTPRLDALARQGVLYTKAWSNAPVCAPARTCIISGLWPTSTGGQHMRSQTRLPPGFLMYPQYLRQAGYYCTNRHKEDYNLEKPGQVWDESSRKAHFRNRKPGQPFFAIFNFTTTHESQVRRRPHEAVNEPARVKLPAYHPDIPEVRQDRAQYYDKMTRMDAQCGEILDQLAEDGLTEDTIIFYYGDHGPGLPRGKRWPYNSGLHVPLIVVIPEKHRALAPPGWQPGGHTDRLVGFIDLAPTLLSLAGLEPPKHFQGVAFLGPHRAPAPRYSYGFRGRMDERYDMVRSLRDQRFVYLRHYMPHRIYGQHVRYMFQTPTTHRWKALYDAGQLTPPRTFFWEEKPVEELYDLESDPDEVVNLATSPTHRAQLERFRAEEERWTLATRDVGFLPEPEIHTRSQGSTPWEMARDESRYPLARIAATARLAAGRDLEAVPELLSRSQDTDSAVRFWAVRGFVIRGRAGVRAAGVLERLRALREDSRPSVRILASFALARHGDETDLAPALGTLLAIAGNRDDPVQASMMALEALDRLDERARSVREKIRALSTARPGTGRYKSYLPRLHEKTLADLED